MTTRQIFSPRNTIPDAGGILPLIGGKIDIFEPNSATRITTYKDSGLSVANSNPVILDVGRASVWISRDADVRVLDKDDNLVFEDLSVNPLSLSASTSSGLVPNGSFEEAAVANTPDGWTKVDETGSTNILDTTTQTDGLQSMKFQSAGNGGGNIITDNFFVVNGTDDLSVQFDLKSSVVDVRNIVRIEWFDASKVSISNDDIYDNAASNPTTFTSQNLTQSPPATARFAKIRLIGCDPSDATVGSTWFDKLSVFYPLVVNGVFDNITVQNNEVISTNTNGNVDINPDGTGRATAYAGVPLHVGYSAFQAADDATVADGDSFCTISGVPVARYRVDAIVRFSMDTAPGTAAFRINGTAIVDTAFFLADAVLEGGAFTVIPLRKAIWDGGSLENYAVSGDYVMRISGQIEITTAGTVQIEADEGTATIGTLYEGTSLQLTELRA